MIVSIKDDFFLNDNLKKIEYLHYEVFYQGVIFCRKLKTGEETIKYILNKYNRTDKISFKDIYGAFIIIIIDKNTGKKLIFTDNSKMRSFYLGKNFISNSFLELIKYEKELNYDMDNVAQFITLGVVYFGKTVFQEIKLTLSEKYYEIIEGKILEKDKEIGDIYNPLEKIKNIQDVNKFFDDISYAVKDLNVSFDITGGFDSRMVLCEMKDTVGKYGLFISGPKEAKDVMIADKISKLMKLKLNHFIQPEPKLSLEYLKSLFFYVDGVFPIVSGEMREKEFNDFRKKLGYNLRITGDGGVLHKDWWWIQDIPFYNKKLNEKKLLKLLSKFYDQRIAFLKTSTTIFSEDLKKAVEKQKQLFINKCTLLSRKINTETYDMLYFHLSGSKRSLTYNFSASKIDWYAPLWERELVRFSYHLPRIKRFNNNYQREIITMKNYEISKLITNYGVTSCSKLFYKLLDIPRYILDLSFRVLRMLQRKYFNRNAKSDIDIYDPFKEIYKMELFDKVIENAKIKNFLDKNISKEKIPKSIISSLVTLYFLGDYINKNKEL